MKKNINSHNPQEVEGMNFEEESMDDCCREHNAYHSKKIVCQFINMYNSFLAPATECNKGKSEKEKVEEEVDEEEEEEEEKGEKMKE